jgi:predicted ATPase/DNA-binding SARP family transcriptional activator
VQLPFRKGPVASRSPGHNGVVTDGERLQVEVLGPIRVIGQDGRDLTPTGTLQRRLLALLILRRGQVVSSDAAIDALWPSGLPRDPTGALQNHLSRLRQALGPGVIGSVGDGYRLDPSTVELDSDRLAISLGESTGAGAPHLADADAVLARWTGPAYPELDHLDDARAESMRLAELRMRAKEARMEQRLAQGESAGVVAELTAMVAAEPLRERPRSLLMAALAATGRRVEALRSYDDFRRVLGDELGIEPSPLLSAQHAELLAGGTDEIAESVPTWSSAGRLPVPPTSLVARDRLVQEVTTLAESHRLVSLVGPGGVGKTRLLVEVGHRLRAARPTRAVVLCELAAADEASAVTFVAAALGIDARPGVPLVERIVNVLGDADVVVLVDNCEHVLVPIAGVVAPLIAHCPNATVVATSRERLRVPAERVCAVPTLPVVGHDAAAVKLFVERARAVVPEFDPDPADLACVAEIVTRLDGLPLAIELAAARLHTHALPEVAAGLDRRFALLTSGDRTTARHESLGAAVSWSFGLLDESLQAVFASLSIFSGTFSADDAAAVCDLDLAHADAALSQLVERSLVMRAPGGRYLLLETLRAFGAEQLAALGHLDRVGERHARHLVAWAERADAQLFEPATSAIADIEAAIPELQAALGWLVDHDDSERAGRLIAALVDFGFLRLRPDVLAWAERVIEIDPDDLSPLAPRVWVAAAYAAWMAGDMTECAIRTERALAVVERSGLGMVSEVAATRGNLALFAGQLGEAIDWYRQGITLAADDPPQSLFVTGTEVLALGYAGDPSAEPLAERLLAAVADRETPYAAYAWYCAGEADLAIDLERARTRLARAIDLASRTQASFVTGLAGASMASIDARFGDPEAAVQAYRQLIDHWRRAGMWSTQWTMLRSIATLLARLGRHRDAAVLASAVLATSEGHSIFGADELAMRALELELRAALGDDEYELARAEGSLLDGDAAVEHALGSL